MPLFHFIGHDKPGALQVRLGARADHLAYVTAFVRVGGPLLDDQGQPVGSAMIIEADSLEDAKAKLAQDPYAKAGLFESTSVQPWRLSIGSLQGCEG